MSDKKLPLHEVLSQKLHMRTTGITKDWPPDASPVRELLDSLFRGKMKAADAHRVAEDHAGLPELLKSAGQDELSEFAEEVLTDLRGREDEKKQEQTPAPVQSQTRVDHDLPVHRGN